ncbi:unnamed protein product [Camellia sinensis]
MGLDSLDTVEIVKALEEEFKLEILWSFFSYFFHPHPLYFELRLFVLCLYRKLYAVICDPSGPLYFCSQGYAYGMRSFQISNSEICFLHEKAVQVTK